MDTVSKQPISVLVMQAEYENKDDDLSSECNVDYTRLRNLLKAGKWKDADYETCKVMLKVVGRKDGDSIRVEELLNFPCSDLRTIDNLWVKYSNGRFGFSVQKKIYLGVGGKANGIYYQKAWHKFVDRVGWKKGGWWNKRWISYDEVTFDTSAPEGHLPALGISTALVLLTVEDIIYLGKWRHRGNMWSAPKEGVIMLDSVPTFALASLLSHRNL
jgi:hypothetical protein